jgi:hypothetical protein
LDWGNLGGPVLAAEVVEGAEAVNDGPGSFVKHVTQVVIRDQRRRLGLPRNHPAGLSHRFPLSFAQLRPVKVRVLRGLQ